MPEIILKGILFTVKVDKEGESRITLCFSLSEINKVAEVSKLTERLLNIKINTVED